MLLPKTSRLIVVVAAAVALLSSAARAEVSQSAINRAHQQLVKKQTGLDILGFVHFGAAYKGHTYTATRAVVDANGKTRPGHFGLVYSFEWEDNGVTEVGFLCDHKGNVYDMVIVKTNAILQQPFAVADLMIEILSEAILSAIGDDLSATDKKVVRQLIEAADSKRLLLFFISMSQE